MIHDLALHSSGRQLAILLIFSSLILFRHLLAPFAWVLLTQTEKVPRSLCSVLVDSRTPSPRNASPPLSDGRPNPAISTSGFLRSSSLASNCRASSVSVCVRSLLHQCVFITQHELFHACPAFVCMWLRHSLRSCGQSRTSLTFWGPYRVASCFRKYLRLCCDVLTIASGKGINTAGTGGGLTSSSCPMSIHGTPRHFRMNSLSHCWSAVFPLNSRTSQQSTL